MATITFSNSFGSCSLPAPNPGRKEQLERIQSVGRSAGGALIVADGELTRRRTVEPFRALTDAQRSSLEGFFSSGADGMGKTFTYTDSSSATHTVRFGEPRLEWTRPGPDVNNLDVILEFEES